MSQTTAFHFSAQLCIGKVKPLLIIAGVIITHAEIYSQTV